MQDTSNASTAVDRIIRLRSLSAHLGVSDVTIWRMRQRGELPEPIRISMRAKGWRESTINAWLAARG